MRGLLQLLFIEIDDVATLPFVVIEHVPGQGMITLAHPKKAAERHNRIDDLARALVDHNVVNRAEGLALTIVDFGAFDFARGNEAARLTRCDRARTSLWPPFRGTVLVSLASIARAFKARGGAAKAPHAILFLERVADGVLGLAPLWTLPAVFFGRAFGLGPLVAGDLADGLLHRALDLPARTLDPILVDRSLLF
jgi:hypothetical protein